MSSFAILFFIFATCVLLAGLYMYTGHKIEILAWKAAFKNHKKDEWKNIGKWTMINSIPIFLIAIIGWIFNF